ncbi:unnamed protein product [Dracunculus medinensis]|uniref:Methyltransferase domain-containing protein n=1 Tax=Dracunculus medinensis TaxID=318479 RepID=A0A3P7Q427_DRAME|nr:unnamed protein product [Dracunculus medinensis]
MDNYAKYGDNGEIWFGKRAENRIVQYIEENIFDKSSRIIDLGCGNGSLLHCLQQKQFTKLFGVDYCNNAVNLAKNIVIDLLDKNVLMGEKFDVVIDKGTWDAMSLSNDRNIRLLTYRNLICKILDENGIFIMISFFIGFSFSDLMEFVCGINLASHTLKFGGSTGVTTSGVVFRKFC